MRLQFFTVPAKFPQETQCELNTFCAQHRVLNMDKQFVNLGNESYWSICVTVMESRSENIIKHAGNKRESIDYKEILSEEDFAIYIQLRNLRKMLSEQQGIPAYTLFTNEQLANMVTQRVNSLSDLAKIEGIGKSRLEKYGESFLLTLQSARGASNNQGNVTTSNETTQS